MDYKKKYLERIKNISSTKSSNNTSPNTIIDNNTTFRDLFIKANAFNKYFSTIKLSIQSSIRS